MADSASLNRGLKRRLVGALALVVISLAITPLLFDAAGYKERQLENRIPPAPKPFAPLSVNATSLDVEAAVIEIQSASAAEPVNISPAPAAVEEAVRSAELGPAPAIDTPSLDQDGLPVAWALQLASFRDERNARALQADLLKDGYKVYIRRSDSLVRVYIGPEMQRSRLESLQESIKTKYSLDGMITRFSVE
ncbi:MAG: SPOR domain-containing protein [Oceanospirillaceae bacterium]|nr:SPOR domain-containing protein [Oceanospirillaceae bacterium]